MGTACYVKGADKIIDAITEKHKIRPGETTADNKLSLLTARCFGSCGLAPAATFDGEVVGKLTPETAVDRIRRWMDHDA